MISFREIYLAEKETPGITMAQMEAFERAVDKILKPYGLDFRFTKHFKDRMSDPRNKPKISIEELASLFKKIYRKQGKPLNKHKDIEVVIKDLNSDINMPVALEYDAKNDEIDVVAKTIMRKKNFTTPNKKIVYERKE